MSDANMKIIRSGISGWLDVNFAGSGSKLGFNKC